MAIKLIAVDIDGTLVNSQKQVTAAVRDAVLEAAEAGIEVALGTGRAMDECFDILEALPELRYAVCCTGADVYDIREKKHIYSEPIALETVRLVYDRLREVDCLFEVMSCGTIYVDADRFPRLAEYRYSQRPGFFERSRTQVCLPELLRDLDRPIEKLHLLCRDAAAREQAEALLTDLDLLVLHSVARNLEINTPTASKGVGLMKLAAYLGIAREETMAIGDNTNDLGMLQSAGYSVAMANAHPDVFPHVRYITRSNDEDGVAAAIRHVLAGTVDAMKKENL